MSSLANANLLKTVLAVSSMAVLALGTSGCSNEKRNHRFNMSNMNPYYRQNRPINNTGLTGTNWNALGQNQNQGQNGAGDLGDRQNRNDGRGQGSSPDGSGCKDGSCNSAKGDGSDKGLNGNDPGSSGGTTAAQEDVVAKRKEKGIDTKFVSGQAIVVDRDPIWTSLCPKDLQKGVDVDADGIPDKCENELLNQEWGTDSNVTQGLAVKGVAFNKKYLKAVLEEMVVKRGIKSLFDGKGKFEEFWAALVDRSNPSESSLDVIGALLNEKFLDEKGTPTGYGTDTQGFSFEVLADGQSEEDGYSYIGGGYKAGNAIPFNLDFQMNPPSMSSFNGIGRNFDTEDRDKFYLVGFDGFITMPSNSDFTGAIQLAELQGNNAGAKPLGFMVFVDGNLEIHAGTDLKESVIRGKIKPGCHHLAIVALVGNEGSSEYLFNRNILIEEKDDHGSMWQLLPSEMLSVTKTAECADSLRDPLFAATRQPIKKSATVRTDRTTEDAGRIAAIAGWLKQQGASDALRTKICAPQTDMDKCAKSLMADVAKSVPKVEGVVSEIDDPQTAGNFAKGDAGRAEAILTILKAKQEELDEKKKAEEKVAREEASNFRRVVGIINRADVTKEQRMRVEEELQDQGVVLDNNDVADGIFSLAEQNATKAKMDSFELIGILAALNLCDPQTQKSACDEINAAWEAIQKSRGL